MERFSDELRNFIDTAEWIFAKRYASTWPHYYIVRERVDERLFVKLVEHIRQYGYEGRHDPMIWFVFLLSTMRRAYREFEERADRQRPKRGSKTDLIEYALQNIIGPFGIADIERLCPNVSRDTIRLAMNRWRDEGRLKMLGKGRDAKWEKT